MSGVTRTSGAGSIPVTSMAAATPAAAAASSVVSLTYGPFAQDPAFSAVASGARTWTLGEAGAHVKTLEQTLLALGYGFQGGSRADEQLTRASQNALARFQRDHGVASDGILNAETLAALDLAAREKLGQAVASPRSRADLSRIGRALDRAVADGMLEADEVAALFEAAGNRVSEKEVLEIRAAVINGQLAGVGPYDVAPGARQATLDLATVRNIGAAEAQEILSGVSFGGTEVPEAVREVLANARLAGAIAYDVQETKTKSDGTVEGVWSPYPATTPPIGNMAFDYTEITPEALKADMADTSVRYNQITGTEKRKEIDPSTGKEFEYDAVTYREGQGGTGNVLSHYDHAWHEDLYARGSQGQKWANNFAILSDGSIHALPASRRSERQDVILTNPHLSRGKRMMFNGHLDIRSGVVVGVEMSGRLSKMAARGKATFIDPIPVLKAWGFEIAPNVRLRSGNTSAGVPVQDPETGTIHAR